MISRNHLCAIGMLAAMATSAPAAAPPLTAIERQRLVAHLEMTERWLVDEVSGLSPSQLDFHATSATWSVRDVVDHLVVVGTIYWDDLQTALKGPAAGRRSSQEDADILWYGIDRTNRETAIPPERPKGLARDLPTALKTFRADHARLANFIKTTQEDLRSRIVARQQCDAYQWALLISTHEQRHILQIREIKSHTGFPKQ
jgi:DinB family protein